MEALEESYVAAVGDTGLGAVTTGGQYNSFVHTDLSGPFQVLYGLPCLSVVRRSLCELAAFRG